MKCYHHNDADGRCAAAIVFRYWKKAVPGERYEFFEVDYKDTIAIEEQVDPGETVIIVDFSFKPELMNKLLKRTDAVIWIDHHKTAFEYIDQYDTYLPGKRDVNFSGCELAWQYFAPGLDYTPPAVKLIGDRDKWAWKLPDTAAFCEGLKLYSHGPTFSLWLQLLREKSVAGPTTRMLIEKGRTCLTFRDSICKDYRTSYGFETAFAGHKAYAMNLRMFGSEAFGQKFRIYPLCLAFAYSGDKWTVSLYSKTIDVSEIAVKYGGGGHTNAAGFVCTKLPFCKGA